MACTYLRPTYCHRDSNAKCQKIYEGVYAGERLTGDPLSLSYPPSLRLQGSVPLRHLRGY